MITDSIIEQGRILFSKFGFQKTSIYEITQSVGIAQGTFYNFFDSKEELYFVILELEEKNIKSQLTHIDIFKDNQPKKAIKKMLLELMETIETNPLIRDLYFGNHINTMVKKLSTESLDTHFKNDANSLIPLLEKWKNKGITLKTNTDVIAGILRSLFILTLHQKEIGENVFQETIELFIDLIIDGIVIEE